MKIFTSYGIAVVVSAATIFSAFAVQAYTPSTISEDLVSELQTMGAVYRSLYAPADWKKQFANYDLNTELKKALIAAQPQGHELTPGEAREILKNFIYAMKDYHVSIRFVSTESASLPITVMGSQGRYFIVSIDRNKLGIEHFPFRAGDELIAIDGKPTAQAVAEIQAQIPANISQTDRALAQLRLTNRSAATGLKVPQGAVSLSILPKGATHPQDIQLIWEYTPEEITPAGNNRGASNFLVKDAQPFFNPQMSVDLDVRNPNMDDGFGLGEKKSYLPALGQKVWESNSDSIFHAYIFRTPTRKLIGYVRIPGYITPNYTKAVAEFKEIVTRFEANTDSLVIDQLNNPGGSVFYLYALASMLTDKPLKTPRHRMALDPSSVAEAESSIKLLSQIKTDAQAKALVHSDELSGYPASFEFVQFLLSYAHLIKNEWHAGKRLTQPYWIAGVDHINPAENHYSKPILLLVNELDFSGGDFFPAIMQDNERVKVMGTRTAGAGGYVNDIRLPNSLGIDRFRVTESIAERLSGHPIENLGVVPEIAYELTPDDLMQGFASYRKAILGEVEKITP